MNHLEGFDGFILGERIWVEVICGSVRFEFLGRVLHVTETLGGNFHVGFVEGGSINFNHRDIETRIVVVHRQRGGPAT